MKRLSLSAILILLVCTALSAKEQYIYTQISQKEGLTSTINCIFKEQDGDVWLGTPGGIYRFNGTQIRSHADSLSQGRKIFHCSKDKVGNFWILTDRHVLCRKAGSDVFVKVDIPDARHNQPFYSMCEDEDGIWIGSTGSLYRYTYSDQKAVCFLKLDDMPSFLFRHMNLLDDKTMLCCSHNGMILIDTETGTVQHTPFGSHKEVSSAMIDSRGWIWIAFYNNGIEVFDRDGKPVKKYTSSNSALSSNLVLCMTERDSTIWAGTDGGGINIIDPKTDNISVLSHIAGDPSSLPAHSIKSIYTDHHGNIWAGSVRDGLIRISRSEMNTYGDVHWGLKNGLSNPTVLYLYQDPSEDYIWIGTDGEGLNRFDPDKNEFTHYKSTLKTKVVSIASYSEDELAISVYSDRIWIFNKNTGVSRPLEAHDEDLNYQFRYAGLGVNLANENDGSLLIISNLIYRFDKKTGKCIKIKRSDNLKATSSLLVIGNDERGIWLHDNFNIFLLETGSTELMRKGRLGETKINCGHFGDDDTIWLATDSGLYRFSIEESKASAINTGLFDKALSVVCDNSSRVWVGTENHLYAFLSDSENFALFGESDGAAKNEYLSKPHLLARDGSIYMGGVKGMLVIDPAYTIDNTENPSISLYELIVDGQPYKVDNERKCRLPRDSKTLNINVSVQERDILREKMYRFYISEDTDPYETAEPSLSLHQTLPAGSYEVRVSCTRRNGEWSCPESILTLEIPKPWYMTWWFITIVSSFIFIMSVLIHYTIAHRKNTRIQLALKEQEQKMYEEKVQLLINISHELRTPLTLILAPLKRLIKSIESDGENYPTLKRIYRQSLRMKDLLNMVLDLRKMEVGKNKLKIEKRDFNRWLSESIADIADEEREEGIIIVTDLDPAVGDVEFDKSKCDTVLMNIMMNAVKHSKLGDTITVRTEVTASGAVRTSISDQGPGLGDIDMSRMFTRFYQSNSEQYGSGIGLSYSKILTELHGGAIGAMNNPDKGATFWWEIPITCKCTNVETPAKAYLNELMGYNPGVEVKTPESPSFNTSGMKLMLVDDNADLLDFLQESMGPEFAEMMTVGSGSEAMKILKSGALPDIIVSDINMPDGDGYWLCSQIKQNIRYSHIPVVLLTARGEEQSQSDSYRIGADAFLAKPFDVETLLELVRNLLKVKADIRTKYLDNDGQASSEYGSEEESFILQLNRIIAEHISDPELDQQLICKELGVSRALLYNKMKAITGRGTKEYINHIRLEKAKSLIETTSLSIAEISEMTGFSAQSYFSTAFKGYTGLTPSQYKQKWNSQS